MLKRISFITKTKLWSNIRLNLMQFKLRSCIKRARNVVTHWLPDTHIYIWAKRTTKKKEMKSTSIAKYSEGVFKRLREIEREKRWVCGGGIYIQQKGEENALDRLGLILVYEYEWILQQKEWILQKK